VSIFFRFLDLLPMLLRVLRPGLWCRPLTLAARGMFIKTATTPNPDSLKFYSLDLTFLNEGKVLDFPGPHAAQKSPLARDLFEVAGVKGVFIADDYITVTKKEDAEWRDLNSKVFGVITNWKQSGKPLVDESAETSDDCTPSAEDSEVVLAIKELLESRIKPMVQRDGGNIRYVGFEDGIAYVQLQGACSTCPSSTNTLKGGIERMLMHWVPEVEEVREVNQEDADLMTTKWKECKTFK
jgi:Fe-S cluster biogenesis protein NfuA